MKHILFASGNETQQISDTRFKVTTHCQKMTVAASAMADRKTFWHPFSCIHAWLTDTASSWEIDRNVERA